MTEHIILILEVLTNGHNGCGQRSSVCGQTISICHNGSTVFHLKVRFMEFAFMFGICSYAVTVQWTIIKYILSILGFDLEILNRYKELTAVISSKKKRNDIEDFLKYFLATARLYFQRYCKSARPFSRKFWEKLLESAHTTIMEYWLYYIRKNT